MNTKELRGYKVGLKSKLMGAVAMLLVSAIMVSSATYAWFVLSTHPEVKGMSTTVGSNGALEIALLGNETGTNLGSISSGVGNSSAADKQTVQGSNETWGNIVDLSDASYGWDDIKLYPAALNANGTESNVTFADRSALLKYAKYGTDGRITELAADTAAGKQNEENTGFVVNATANDYGVRAIGTTTKANPEALALAKAKTSYKNAISDAKSAVEIALNKYQQALSGIATTHANEKDSSPAEYTQDDVDAINNSLEAVKNAAQKLQEALKWAKAAKQVQEQNLTTVPSVDSITIEESDTGYDLNTALSTIVTNAETNKIGTQDAYYWSNIQGAYQHLMDTNTMTFTPNEGTKGYTIEEMKTIDPKDAATMLIKGAKITLKGGAFVQIADYVGGFETAEFSMQFVYQGKTEEAEHSYYSVTTEEEQLKMAAITSTVNALVANNGGSAQETITNVYGYIIDLAFQTNMEGELQLQSAAGQNRVSSDKTTATQGGGTLFTVKADAAVDTNALAAMRVVFIDGSNKILAVGKFDTNGTTTADGGTAYALHLYEYTFENGVLKVDAQKAADTITTLTPNTPVAVSALVYLDGDSTSYAQGGVTGTLNLQFKHSADLTPMTYDFSTATTGGDTTGDDQNP